MKDLKYYFKMVFQFQACFVDNSSIPIKRAELLKLYNERKKINARNYGYGSGEQFELISPTVFHKKLISVFKKLTDEDSYNGFIEFQLLELRDSELISYYISNNRIQKIGSTSFPPNTIKKIFEKYSYVYISFIDLNLLSELGRGAMFEALKKAGEHRVTLKETLVTSELQINYNSLAHYAKLNINSIVVLDALGVNL